MTKPLSTGKSVILPINPSNLERAAACLKAGELVGIPTETVYGLGADATNGIACARIFEVKGRPRFNPLIAHCGDRTMASEHGLFDRLAKRLADAFWPGPLTLVVPRDPGSNVSDLVTAGLDTIALRIADGPAMVSLANRLEAPIAAPSANRSGHVSATSASAVEDDLGDGVALILDAGPSRVGLESTIVDLSSDKPRLLRPGGLSRAAIEEAIGTPLSAAVDPEGRPQAPGMLSAHYAPSCPVRCDVSHVEYGEGLILFGNALLPDAGNASRQINLSPDGDLREAAAGLFQALRDLDAANVRSIAVAPIPHTGLGEAINDRLKRASMGRAAPGLATGSRP
ncbi:MAG: L-threonylcarbamoyladenylate synthase [Pseudomonadota bacterium]